MCAKKPKRFAGVLSGRPLCVIRRTYAPMLTGHSSKHSTVYIHPPTHPPLRDDLPKLPPPWLSHTQMCWYAFVPFILWRKNTGTGQFEKDPRAGKVLWEGCLPLHVIAQIIDPDRKTLRTKWPGLWGRHELAIIQLESKWPHMRKGSGLRVPFARGESSHKRQRHVLASGHH